MTRVALLLRGVNVGGVTLRSADLRELLTDAGLADVTTVLASGNAIVTAASADAARAAAEAALLARTDRSVRVCALTIDALERIVAAYPFPETGDTTPYVVFELEPGVAAALAGDADAATETAEPIALGDAVVYWANPKGTSTDSPFAKRVVRVGRDATTTRNLRTLRKVVAAA